MGRTIGIDLGTTNSAVATVEDGDVKVLDNAEGFQTTPSVVFFDGDTDEPLVGLMAKNSAATAPHNTVQFIKRRMGKQETLKSPGGKEFTPEMISALILKKLRQDAEAALGESGVTDVVITVPAYFDDARRTATKQAGAIAGLNVLQMINEPTAAAVAFGVNNEKGGKVLVYDLGGGTFDVTLMEIKDGEFDVIRTAGDSNLGGVNFDQKLAQLIISELETQGYVVGAEDDMLNAEIREKAETAKRTLSTKEQAKTIHTIDGKTYTVKLTREQFEEATKTLLDRTRLHVTDILKGEAGKDTRDLNLTWDRIDHLLVIGGSTRMPMVKNMLEEMSGKTIKYEVNPDTAVAQGAAILANTIKPERSSGLPSEDSAVNSVKISDVTSQTLGVITVSRHDRSKRENTRIIPHNTKIPTKMSRVLCTLDDNQPNLMVRVTEGDDDNVDYVKIIGSSTFALPPYKAGAEVEVIYQYDIDQTVFIEVIDLTANKSLGTFDIDRSSNLSKEQLSDAIEVVRGIDVE